MTPAQTAFLAAIEHFPHIGMASKASGLTRQGHHRAKKADPEYAAAFAEAWEIGISRIRDRAIQFVYRGIPEPLVYKGEIQYQDKQKTKPVIIHKFPERLMMKVLGSEIPEVYNRNRMEVTGKDGGPLEASIEVVFISPKKE